MAGIKISNLPAATTPLAGSETIAIVQSTCTKSTPVSAISDIVCSSFVTSSQYAATSGVYTTVNSASATWDGVYSSYQSTSADFAQTDTANCFSCPQVMADLQVNHLEAGYQVTANGACASVLGGYYNDAGGAGSAVAAGYNNDTLGEYSVIAGGACNSITCNGTGGFIAGGSTNIVKHANSVAMGTCTVSVSSEMLHVNRLYANNLPTSDPGVAGVVWNDSGNLKISV